MNYLNKAEILIEALPYIKKFWQKTMVLKYGGEVLENKENLPRLAEDIALIKYVGIRPVIIHGGGKQISQQMEKMGKEIKFIEGLRITDEEAMEIVEMTLSGKIANEFTSSINKLGIKAVSLSGADAQLIMAKPIPELGYCGTVDKINPEIIYALQERNFVPVISSIGVDEEGRRYNINADEVAAKLAVQLRAEKLIIFTNVGGVLENIEDSSSIISVLNIDKIEELIKNKKVEGGMLQKVMATKYAVLNDVKEAHIINGEVPHSLLIELFTKEGIGTLIIK